MIDEDAYTASLLNFPIARGGAALLVIDMTNDFVADDGPYATEGARRIIENVNAIIAGCRSNDIPIVFFSQAHRSCGTDLGAVRHIHPLTRDGAAIRVGTDGVKMFPTIDYREGDELIWKRRYNAFFGTDLDIVLRGHGVDTLIVVGVATNVCCESTVREAFFRDYKVIVVEDANGATGLPNVGWGEFSAEQVQAYCMTNVRNFFGEVVLTKDVLARMSSQPKALATATA